VVPNDPARERELELARQVHYGFLPRSFANEALDVAVGVLPYGEIGGDYGSVCQPDDDRVLACICDATGHGIASALFAARVNTFVLSHARGAAHPCALVDRLNAFLCEHLPFTGMFATFFSIFFDLSTRTLSYAGAGHPPALHYMAADGRIDEMASETMMVGVSHPLAKPCAANERSFAAGDRILLYTDGLTEAFDETGRPRGRAEATAFLRAHHALDGAVFNERLLASLTEGAQGGRTGALDDDVLLMTVTVK